MAQVGTLFLCQERGLGPWGHCLAGGGAGLDVSTAPSSDCCPARTHPWPPTALRTQLWLRRGSHALAVVWVSCFMSRTIFSKEMAVSLENGDTSLSLCVAIPSGGPGRPGDMGHRSCNCSCASVLECDSKSLSLLVAGCLSEPLFFFTGCQNIAELLEFSTLSCYKAALLGRPSLHHWPTPPALRPPPCPPSVSTVGVRGHCVHHRDSLSRQDLHPEGEGGKQGSWRLLVCLRYQQGAEGPSSRFLPTKREGLLCPSTSGPTQLSARPVPDLPALPCRAGVPGGDPTAREDGAVEQDCDRLPGEPMGVPSLATPQGRATRQGRYSHPPA